MTAPGPLTLEDLERLARKQTGCTDGGCVFGHPGGMHTNGGCKCVPRGGHVHPDEARAVRDAAIRERDAVKAGAFDVFRQAVAERDEALALLSKAREAWAAVSTIYVLGQGDPRFRAGWADLAKILGTGETT